MLLFSGKRRRSNKELLEDIILENYNQYYRLAFSYTHNQEDAKDIVQNGAYKALRSHDSLKTPEFAKTWLYRIMLNECFSYMRHPRELSYETIVSENGIDLGSTEDTYLNVDLKNALDQLSEKDKAIIILKYFEDKTLEDIAFLLDENLNTVKSRLYRSLRKLRAVLDTDSDTSNRHIL